MKLIFNINRFAKVLQMEFRLHQKTYLIFLGLTLLDLLITMTTYSATIDAVEIAVSTSADPNIAKVTSNLFDGVMPFRPGGAFGLLLAIIPFALYGFLYHPTKSLTYAMLPASQFEKFVSAFVQCVIIVPFNLFVFSLLISGIGDLAGVPINWSIVNFDYILTKYWLPAICIQSIAFWGVFWFKKQKLAKTVLTLTTFVIGFLLINRFFGDYSFVKFITRMAENEGFVTNGMYAAMVVLWAAAFIKFPRTQI